MSVSALEEERKKVLIVEHPILQAFFCQAEDPIWKQFLDQETSKVENRIERIYGPKWMFLALPGYIRIGKELDIFDEDLEAKDKAARIRDLFCMGFDVGPGIRLFRMEIFGELLLRGYLANVFDEIMKQNRFPDEALDRGVRFIQAISVHGAVLSDRRSGNLDPTIEEFLRGLDTTGL